MPRCRRRMYELNAVLLALSLVAAACGDDDDEASSEPNNNTESTTSDEPADPEAGTIGYIVAGDRSDGGFYQGQVEAVQQTGEDLGYEVIVVDKVNPGAAQEAFENLARQSPDLIIAGGSELRDGLIPVSESPEFADINFVIVAGFPPTTDTYATVGGNENEAHYMGGVAVGLLLQRAKADTACIVAGPELDFVKNMDASMKAGLESVQKEAEMLVTYTGDFEDAGLAQEATTAQISQGCQVVYPYLGGALTAVVKAGNDAGIDVVSTSVDRCEDPTTEFAMAILYNPALYLSKIIEGFEDGKIVEGEQFQLFGVGDGVDIGAKLCDATADEQQVLDDAAARIASGDIDVAELIGSESSG